MPGVLEELTFELMAPKFVCRIHPSSEQARFSFGEPISLLLSLHGFKWGWMSGVTWAQPMRTGSSREDQPPGLQVVSSVMDVVQEPMLIKSLGCNSFWEGEIFFFRAGLASCHLALAQ